MQQQVCWWMGVRESQQTKRGNPNAVGPLNPNSSSRDSENIKADDDEDEQLLLLLLLLVNEREVDIEVEVDEADSVAFCAASASVRDLLGLSLAALTERLYVCVWCAGVSVSVSVCVREFRVNRNATGREINLNKVFCWSRHCWTQFSCTAKELHLITLAAHAI